MGGMMGGRIDDGKHDELYKNEKIVVKVKLIKKIDVLCTAFLIFLLFSDPCSGCLWGPAAGRLGEYVHCGR